MDTPEYYTASDYAGLKTSKWEFYYGYETEWSFTAKHDGQEICRIPFDKLRIENGQHFDCVRALNVGIGWVIEKFGIDPDKTKVKGWLKDALERSGYDFSLCSKCGLPVICLPDGMPICEPCAKKGN